MEIKEFIEKFSEAIECETALSPNTEFHNLEEWSSLAYLSVIALLDEEYGVQIEMNEFRNIRTIEELYKKVETVK